MSAEQNILTGTKVQQYEGLLLQIMAVIDGETDVIANCANISSMLHQQFDWWWTGFYFVKGPELVLGPFQGTLACTRIAKGKGVCGAAWQREETVIVPDVNAFPGHIACSSASLSEIVVPVFSDGNVVAVLDVDSAALHTFDQVDKEFLEKIVGLIAF